MVVTKVISTSIEIPYVKLPEPSGRSGRSVRRPHSCGQLTETCRTGGWDTAVEFLVAFSEDGF